MSTEARRSRRRCSPRGEGHALRAPLERVILELGEAAELTAAERLEEQTRFD